MDPKAEEIAAKFKRMSGHLDEHGLRIFVASEAISYGRGGIELLHNITGMARTTIKRGQVELEMEALQRIENESTPEETIGQSVGDRSTPRRVRRPGGGRKRIEHHHPGWVEALLKLVDPVTRGDPESSIRWTLKSTTTLSEALSLLGYKVSPPTVGKKLHEIGYSLQSNKKLLSGSSHPDRNAQFEFINKNVTEQISLNNPVISIDTKKKEVLGNFKNQGKRWEPKGCGTKVNDHDFPSPDLPRALPYGIFDINRNAGYVVIGTDHDTSEFAANSIYGWWKKNGSAIYHDASKILITADCGGSNGYRVNLWKYSVQNLADKIKKPIMICHFPPGTSKWNKIEHKLFSFISSNWREVPLVDYETIFNLISSTKTSTGLQVSCYLDYSSYQTGIKLSKEQISSINIVRDDFHGEWNYTILPHD
jgi:hypothetical protein